MLHPQSIRDSVGEASRNGIVPISVENYLQGKKKRRQGLLNQFSVVPHLRIPYMTGLALTGVQKVAHLFHWCKQTWGRDAQPECWPPS